MAKNIKKRSEDYAQWYLDVIKATRLADYAPVRGCAKRVRIVATLTVVSIFSMLTVRGAVAGQPTTSPTATSPSGQTVEDLQTENARLREWLRNSQAMIQSQYQELNSLSKQVFELSAIHKEFIPSTNPVIPEAGEAALRAARFKSFCNLRMIGQALLLYANQHDQKGPATLEELRRSSDTPAGTFQSPLLNSRYHYFGYTNNMRANEVVVYEDTDDPYPSILFADGSVETMKAEQAATIIANRHK